MRACAQPRLRDAFKKQAAVAVTSTPQEITQHLAREIGVWRDIVARANITIQYEVRYATEHAPRFRAPPNSCDAHFHVFGPAERYPAAA